MKLVVLLRWGSHHNLPAGVVGPFSSVEDAKAWIVRFNTDGDHTDGLHAESWYRLDAPDPLPTVLRG